MLFYRSLVRDLVNWVEGMDTYIGVLTLSDPLCRPNLHDDVYGPMQDQDSGSLHPRLIAALC